MSGIGTWESQCENQSGDGLVKISDHTFPRETVNLPDSPTLISAPNNTKISAPSRMNQSFLIVVEKSTWAMEHSD